MTIHLISFASILHKQASLRNSHEAILSELEKYYTVKLIDYQDMDKLGSDDFKIIFIATGGVERLVIQHFERLPRPAILLAALFLIAFGCAYCSQFLALLIMVEIFDLNEYLAQFLGLFIYGAVNYMMNKKITFQLTP